MHIKVSWTRRTVIVAVASSFLGFWLLDGVSWASSLLGTKFPVDIPAKVASSIVCVSLSLVIEQAQMVQAALRVHRGELLQNLRADLHSELRDGISRLVATSEALIAIGNNGASPAIGSLLSETNDLIKPLSAFPEPLRNGVVTWMHGPLDSLRRSLGELTTTGVDASLYQHVAVTRGIFESSTGGYVQINQHAYDVSTEWSREWREFLTSTTGRHVQYIVLGSRDYLAANGVKLRSMHDYLQGCGAELLLVDRSLAVDSLGHFQLETNIEIFDEGIIKTQSLNPAGYRGGIILKMAVSLAVNRPDLVQITRAIRACAVPYKK